MLILVTLWACFPITPRYRGFKWAVTLTPQRVPVCFLVALFTVHAPTAYREVPERFIEFYVLLAMVTILSL